MRGFHPDADGKRLKKGNMFDDLKGQPLATGYKAVVWSIHFCLTGKVRHLAA